MCDSFLIVSLCIVFSKSNKQGLTTNGTTDYFLQFNVQQQNINIQVYIV